MRRLALLFIGCSMTLALATSCHAKKMKQEETLETWLDRNFPGQFVTDRNLRDIHPKHFYEHKNTSIVSSKADSLVQFEITWYKTMDDLGISVEQVTELTANHKRDIEKARQWHNILEAGGLQRFSVGVVDMALYVLPYGEPDPAARLQHLKVVLNALDNAPGAAPTSIYIECMEDSAYQKEIGDIIPFGYWRRKDTYHDDHTIVKIDFEYAKGLEADDINQHWKFNTLSNRSLVFKHAAFAEVEKWAAGNLKAPYYVEPDQYVEFQLDADDMLAVHYAFPVFPQKPDYETYVSDDQRLGFITGSYQTDQRKFSDLKKVDEL